MGRSPCCEKVGLKKGPWTPEEDQKLLTYIEHHGHGSWRALPPKAGNYFNSQLRTPSPSFIIRSIFHFVLGACMHDIYRAPKMWEELSSEVDQLPEARHQKREV